VSSFECLPDSQFSIRPANITSGGLAISSNIKFTISLLDLSDICIAVELGCFLLLCISMLTNYLTNTSDMKFALACCITIKDYP